MDSSFEGFFFPITNCSVVKSAMNSVVKSSFLSVQFSPNDEPCQMACFASVYFSKACRCFVQEIIRNPPMT